MVALGDILIVFLATLCYDYAYSVSSITITDVGDLNFVVSWEPVENYTGMYNLTIEFGSKKLCYTNATSCFLGGKLLEDEVCPFSGALAVTLEVDGRVPKDAWLLNSYFRVGPPSIQASHIDSTNITFVVRGGQTPLYYDPIHRKYRGESWKGQKSPIYMGQRESKYGVTCDYNLTDSSGSSARHERKKNFDGELRHSDGRLSIILKKLKPFSNYSISVWCRINGIDGRSTVHNFTTKEDVPSSGPTIEKPSSERLGCDHRDLRNITFTIKPPPEDQRHGILLFYVIYYRVVTTNQEEWQSEILELSSPPPDSTEVTLDNISRWDAYEVKVFGNNSVGGMSSSVHQFEVLKLNQVQFQPQNVTTKEIREGVWLLKWDHPWPPHTGDCIINYEISTEEKLLGTTNTTSYVIDTNAVGPMYKVKITPMIYNRSGPAFEGSELYTDVGSPNPQGLSQVLMIILSILLAVFIFLLTGCTYLCVQHGPRWTQPFDISNNSVLKAAFAMGDIQPKIPEREEFDTLVGMPPPPPPTAADDGDDDMETVVLIDTPPAGRAGRDAVPRPPIPDHSPPHSTEGSLSEDCDPVVAMEMDVENAPLAFSSSSSVNDDSSRGTGLQSLLPSGSNLNTSCSEDSLGPLPRYPSPTDSGYVQSPPPHQISNQAKPVEDSGYFRFDAIKNIPCRVVIDNRKHERYCDDTAISSVPKYTDSGYVAGTMTPMSSASSYPETTPLQGKYYMMKAIRKQSSIDSEDTVTSGSLSPSDSEMGDGVGSYTKLSHPNTPLSPRSSALPGDELQAGWDLEKDLNSIQFLLHQLNNQVQHSGMSNVG